MGKEIRCSKHSFVVYPENMWCVICANEKANKKRRCETCGKMANFYIGHLCCGAKRIKKILIKIRAFKVKLTP